MQCAGKTATCGRYENILALGLSSHQQLASQLLHPSAYPRSWACPSIAARCQRQRLYLWYPMNKSEYIRASPLGFSGPNVQLSRCRPDSNLGFSEANPTACWLEEGHRWILPDVTRNSAAPKGPKRLGSWVDPSINIITFFPSQSENVEGAETRQVTDSIGSLRRIPFDQ